MVRYIHDWLVREREYAVELRDVGTIGDNRRMGAWDALVSHRRVRVGYSQALNAVLLRYGMTCRLITSRDVRQHVGHGDGRWLVVPRRRDVR